MYLLVKAVLSQNKLKICIRNNIERMNLVFNLIWHSVTTVYKRVIFSHGIHSPFGFKGARIIRCIKCVHCWLVFLFLYTSLFNSGQSVDNFTSSDTHICFITKFS